MNFFKITNRKSGGKDQGAKTRDQVAGIRGQGLIVNCQAGFTMIELVVVLALMTILIAIAYSIMRTPNDRIACKNIYSAMQLAKMKAVSTGYKAYVDFDMNGGAVTNDFYTVYLDTDSDGAFGELSNAKTENEFDESSVNMPDTSGGFPGVALPTGIQFGGKSTSPRGGTMGVNGPAVWPAQWIITDGGVNVTNNRFLFTSKGTATNWGEVYLWDTRNSSGKGCMVYVSSTGLVRMKNWNGSNWN